MGMPVAERPAQVLLLPVRRRRPNVHRRELFLDRGCPRARHDRAALATPSCAGSARCVPAAFEPSPEIRHAHGAAAAGGAQLTGEVRHMMPKRSGLVTTKFDYSDQFW